MGAGDAPYLYDPPSRRQIAYPYSDFDPKAVTRASWISAAESTVSKPKQEGPLVDFNRHPDSYMIVPPQIVREPMPANTKTKVKAVRWVQFGFRLAQLLGGGKSEPKKKDRDDGVSLSSSDTPDEGDAHDTEHHVLFSGPGGAAKKKAAARPKHNIRTTSSTFVSRVQTAEGLAKTLQSKQGDVGLVDALVRMGCTAEVADDSITLTGGDLHGIDIDMETMPDVAPTLAVVAAFGMSTRLAHGQHGGDPGRPVHGGSPPGASDRGPDPATCQRSALP